jgi:hypothetical protein
MVARTGEVQSPSAMASGQCGAIRMRDRLFALTLFRVGGGQAHWREGVQKHVWPLVGQRVHA